jgi:hypothetical protein
MKFEFKKVPVPSRAKKSLDKSVTNVRAFKVKCDGNVIGTVVGSDMAGKPGWGYMREDKLYGGFGTRQLAAERLAAS